MPSRASSAEPLTSAANPLVKRLRRLATDREGDEVLLEGPRVIRQALAAGVELEVLAVREGEDFDAPAGVRVVLGRGLFRELAGTRTPQGALAVARARLTTPGAARQAARAASWPLLVLDGVQDPGNVGAIVRTAAAAGAPAVLVLPGTADPLGAKAVRASAGHVFHLAVARGDWRDLEGLRLVGADIAGRPLAEVDLAGAGALVLGGEARGLSRPMETVALPMAPGVESLNVAAAAAVLLYHLNARISR